MCNNQFENYKLLKIFKSAFFIKKLHFWSAFLSQEILFCLAEFGMFRGEKTQMIVSSQKKTRE